jgi:hypothetical protein
MTESKLVTGHDNILRTIVNLSEQCSIYYNAGINAKHVY